MKDKSKIYLGLILLSFVFAFGVLVFYKKYKSSPSYSGQNTATEQKKADPNKSMTTYKQIVPEGFPKDFPLEKNNIVQSDKTVYTDKKVTQFNVAFVFTGKSDSVWTLYRNYLKSAGYIINKDVSNKGASNGPLMATKNQNSVLIGLSKSGDQTIVHISLLVR